jgi:hypothetical protein
MLMNPDGTMMVGEPWDAPCRAGEDVDTDVARRDQLIRREVLWRLDILRVPHGEGDAGTRTGDARLVNGDGTSADWASMIMMGPSRTDGGAAPPEQATASHQRLHGGLHRADCPLWSAEWFIPAGTG